MRASLAARSAFLLDLHTRKTRNSTVNVLYSHLSFALASVSVIDFNPFQASVLPFENLYVVIVLRASQLRCSTMEILKIYKADLLNVFAEKARMSARDDLKSEYKI